ncbi:MAG: hypothetical protein JST73_12600 [Actinobacteria bacterium]|nr:hypothetical protein [Actinomycetota bacterium]
MGHRIIRPLAAAVAVVALGIALASCTRSNGAVESGTAVVALRQLGVTVDPANMSCTGNDTATVDNTPYGAEQCRNGSGQAFWVLSDYTQQDTAAQAIAYVPMSQAGRVHFGTGWFAVTVDWRDIDGTWTAVGTPTVTPVQSTPAPTPVPVPTAGN